MFTDRLKELRTEKNLTQKQLAEMLVMSKNSICEYEKGRSEPNIEALIKLAKIFVCSIDYLVGRTDEFGNVKYDFPIETEELFLLSTFRQLPKEMKNFLLSSTEFLRSITKQKQE